MSQVLDVLKAARATVEAGKWVPYAPCFDECCIATAIREATKDERTSDLYTAVVDAIRAVIGPLPIHMSIIGWNDSQTSVEPVLAAFDRAIAKQEASE